MTLTIPSTTTVSISGGKDARPIEVAAQLKVEIEAVVDGTVEQHIEQTASGEPKLGFEVLSGSHPAVDVVIQANGLYTIPKYDGRSELPGQRAGSVAAETVRYDGSGCSRARTRSRRNRLFPRAIGFPPARSL